MEEESRLNPLKPARKYHTSNETFATDELIKNPSPKPQTRSSKCLVYILLALVLQSIALLIFGLVVLRIKTPTLQLSAVAVKDLHNEPTSLNVTFVAEVRLHNMNFGRFKFRGGNTTFFYEKATIGVTGIYDGQVGSREKREMNVSVKVMASDRQLSENSMDFSRDIDLGLIKLRSFAMLKGEVRVVKIINRHTTAVMDCNMALNLTSQAIQDLLCQ
ncbi:late embryogenesis abundant protein At1g64065 [Sesamum indicum]|uniref:Late embryogenesis abundant protein At1g64065 n=1 Tax=Sesamum indicum TaxID=4182 RepID=A0A6I9TJW4_SESIN|nr:late embryogenesis abundant protein At1g64065 [Sesamum indicum]